MRRVRFRDPGGLVRDGEWTTRGIEAAGTVFDPSTVKILPPTTPSKIVGVSTNHEQAIEQYDLERPDRPKLFLKGPNAIAGHGDTVLLLPGKELQYEAELGIVIGTQCRNLSRDEAMDAVAGFTCVNDITNHSDQDAYGVRFKSFDHGVVFGPVVVPAESVPTDARITLRVNGELRQDASRAGLRFRAPEIIEEITRYMTLESGDLIPMGTPGNVGMLHDGDRVAIEIDGIGTLEHTAALPPSEQRT